MAFRSRCGEIFEAGRQAAGNGRPFASGRLRFGLADLFWATFAAAVACALCQLPNTSLLEVGPIIGFMLAGWLAATRSLVPDICWRLAAMGWVWGAMNALQGLSHTFQLLTFSVRLQTWEDYLAEYFWPIIVRDVVIAAFLTGLLALAAARRRLTIGRDFVAGAVAAAGAIASVAAAFGYSYFLFTRRF